MTAAPGRAFGAYGLRVTGLADEAALNDLGAAPRGWRPVELRVRRTRRPSRTPEYTDAHATIPLVPGAAGVFDRVGGVAVFETPEPARDDRLVHPFLGLAGIVFSRWEGRLCFHAGAFADGERTFCVLGDKEGGKSTTLAALALRGIPVVAEDVLVVDGRCALAGPRTIDLRPGGVALLGVADRVEPVRDERWRLRLGPVELERELSGFVVLRWGEALALRRLPAAEALREIADRLALKVAGHDPLALLELARLPAWELTRPPTAEALEAGLARLLDLP